MEKIIIKCGPLAAEFVQQILRANIPWWPF